ncbi:MAG: chemotaxis protein CheW [Anaerolineaceae bacterium]|nr:chemotaxis protein CheW [Anaerolineaceae bacterium]
MNDLDYYKILQVGLNADQDSIDSAYRRMALRFHPDLNQSPDATFRMQEVNVAYGILRNPLKRKEFNQNYREPHTTSGTSSQRSWQQPAASRTYTQHTTARPPQRPPERQIPEEQIIIFHLDDQLYGVDIFHMQTILLMQDILADEHAPGFVDGLIKVRGKEVPVIDMRRHFGLPEKITGKDTRIILTEIYGVQVGMIVDAMENYLSVPANVIDTVTSFPNGENPVFIRGFAKIGFQLVVILNPAAMLSERQKEMLKYYCMSRGIPVSTNL